jgi:hypothetical protein
LTIYLAYDIRGIQRYIFAVPKLKVIIGGSALIDKFDKFVKGSPTGKCVFAGGGHGIVRFNNEESARTFERDLVREAHRRGLDLQVGTDSDIRKVANGANRLYTYIPESLEGNPCSISGLFPVPGNSDNKPHHLIRDRVQLGRKDPLGKEMLHELRHELILPESVSDCELVFFRDVNPSDAGKDSSAEDDSEGDAKLDEHFADAGKLALGNRNRCAVIVADGNGMGTQFEKAMELGFSDDKFESWLSHMSSKVSECTKGALSIALREAINQWLIDEKADLERCIFEEDGTRKLVLPFRPLIRGGDDIIILVHCKYAISFVRNLAEQFQTLSVKGAKTWTGGDLWPATKNQLTMSAGVLFTQTTMPLHFAIEYAESLLANAKSKYRDEKPMPAAVDFDVVTESLIDTPTERRRRELQFLDADLDQEVHLSRRPYRLDGSDNDSLDTLFELVEGLGKLPGTIRSQLLPKMRQPWSERLEFLASIAKHHLQLFEMLQTDNANAPGCVWEKTPGDNGSKVRLTTSLADALVLLDEENRVKQGKVRT